MTAEHISCASNLQRTPQATGEVKSWARRRGLAARRRLDDLEDELPEVLLLDDGPSGQSLGDFAVEDENQAELDSVALTWRPRKAGDGELRGSTSGTR